jgi:hypothetical protein
LSILQSAERSRLELVKQDVIDRQQLRVSQMFSAARSVAELLRI